LVKPEGTALGYILVILVATATVFSKLEASVDQEAKPGIKSEDHGVTKLKTFEVDNPLDIAIRIE